MQYCGMICQLSDRKAHKKFCKDVKKKKLAAESQSETEPEIMKPLCELSEIMAELSVENGLTTDSTSTAESQEENVHANPSFRSAKLAFFHAVSFMKTGKYSDAEQQMIQCSEFIVLFENTLSPEHFNTWRMSRLHNVMESNYEVLKRALLKIINQKNMFEVRELPAGTERQTRTYLLIENIVKEQIMWEQKEEWLRSVELDKLCIALIQEVAQVKEDTRRTVELLDTHIKHALSTISSEKANFPMEDIGFFTKLESHVDVLKKMNSF